jgi:hypothetical protein
MQSPVEHELQFGGKPSPQSIVDCVKHARKPNNSTARAISETNCPPASAKHVTYHHSMIKGGGKGLGILQHLQVASFRLSVFFLLIYNPNTITNQ